MLLKNSLIVTVSATVLVTILAAMLAYYIVRHNNAVSKLTFALMVASMIIPFQAIMNPAGQHLRRNLKYPEPPADADLYAYRIFHGHVGVHVPRIHQRKCTIALEEAACIDGCTRSQTFFKIVLPLLKPIISTMVILIPWHSGTTSFCRPWC